MIAIIGHRGTGKSFFGQQLCHHGFLTQFLYLDLDQEIERKMLKSISNIFQELGEAEFRTIERNVFQDIYMSHRNSAVVVVLGAGFPVTEIPVDVTVIWLQRETDSLGRIFLNRPRLNKAMTESQEYLQKYSDRDEKYSRRAHFIFTVPEGLQCLSKDSLLLKKVLQLFSDLYLEQRHVAVKNAICPWNPQVYFKAQNFLEYELYEIRSDQEHWEEALFEWQNRPILFSLRTANVGLEWLEGVQALDCDVHFLKTYSLSSFFGKKRIIYSSHAQNIEIGIKELQNAAGDLPIELKLCPEVQSFSELKKGHQWQQQDPERRSFLPRSHDGRWSWYRIWQGRKQKINFIREGRSSVCDQPILWQWLLTETISASSFAAVLGSPVKSSYSPAFHFDFFQASHRPYFGILLQTHEWQEGLQFLKEIGMVAASITSPLKELAFQSADSSSAIVADLQSANTYLKSKTGWVAENTDLFGLQKMWDQLQLNSSQVAVWGGGGLLKVLQIVFKTADFYEARTGQPRKVKEFLFAPDVVIWAIPNKDNLQFPPSHWKPKIVVDMNYSEDSRGREYALSRQAVYVSGLDFFKNQALYQQDFWGKHL